MKPPEHLAEFLAAYLAEMEEHLQNADAQLLAVDAARALGRPEPRAVRELFRALHTVKGLSGMVGVEPIVEIAHRMENALEVADGAGGRLGAESIDVLLQGVRAIEERVRALGAGEPVLGAPAALLEELEAIEPPADGGRPPSSLPLEPAIVAKLGPADHAQLAAGLDAGRRVVRLDFTPSQALAAKGATIGRAREEVGKIAEIVKVVPLATGGSSGVTFALLLVTDASDEALARAAGVEADAIRILPSREADPEAPKPPGAPGAPGAPGLGVPRDEPPLARLDGPDAPGLRSGVVRVEVSRLDAAMDRLAALIVDRSRLALALGALSESGASTRDLAQVLGEHARHLRDLRAAILALRMVPVADVLERVPLIVRNLRRTSGKAVRLELEVGRAELDKTVAERIFPAIVHLVRNAVDHALEPSDERLRLGKPEEGLVRIACVARGQHQLELTVSDDGRGVDRAKVSERAGRAASDASLLDLLCLPGLSTRDEATETSGRGMGMDIVRRVVVGELGGELALTTEPGVGTTFTLRVPLTLSIVDALLVECAGQRFAVPVASVEEIVEFDPARVLRGPARAGTAAGVIERRGEALPLVWLEVIFGLGSGTGARKALVVRRGGEPLAYAVDRLLGQQEAVVRTLVDPLVRAPGVAGAADLGDGRPTLVLDLLALGATLTGGRGRLAREEKETGS